QQHAVRIGSEAANGQRSRRLIDRGRRIVELAHMRIAILGLQADLDGRLLEVCRRQAPPLGFGANLSSRFHSNIPHRVEPETTLPPRIAARNTKIMVVTDDNFVIRSRIRLFNVSSDEPEWLRLGEGPTAKEVQCQIVSCRGLRLLLWE